jgi:hypothetical protein
MKPACRNTLSFAEQYCSVAKISRIKTTASFKLVRLMSNTSSAVRKRPHDRCRCKVEKLSIDGHITLARAIRPGANPPFESIPSDRLALPRADKCDGKHGIRMFGCQSPTGRG